VGLDVKAGFADYACITGVPGSGSRALAGLQQVLESGVAYEVRTTVHPTQLNDEAVTELARDLAARGVKHYVIQAFRSQGCMDDFLNQHATRTQPLQTVGAAVADLFKDFTVRAA
jgi:pyruvate formate lyase activating enzyme